MCYIFFCFIKLSGKVSAKLSGDFSMQKLGLSSFKVRVHSHRFLLKRLPWNSGKVKHEIISKNWTDELPHELPNDLRLKIFGNEEIVRLFTLFSSFKWFLNPWIWTGNSWIWTHNFEFQLVLLSFQLVNTHNSCFTISRLRGYSYSSFLLLPIFLILLNLSSSTANPKSKISY